MRGREQRHAVIIWGGIVADLNFVVFPDYSLSLAPFYKKCVRHKDVVFYFIFFF